MSRYFLPLLLWSILAYFSLSEILCASYVACLPSKHSRCHDDCWDTCDNLHYSNHQDTWESTPCDTSNDYCLCFCSNEQTLR